MRIVLLGSGYSAIWCYRALRRHLGDTAEITVVAPFDEHVFHGFTGEVLDGGLTPAMQSSPLAECMPKAEHVRGWATGVDVGRRTVTVDRDGERTVVRYDHLVVATGARERTAAVPGLAEHGWPLRFPGMVGDLLDHLASLEATPPVDAEDAERRRTIVVAGAGFAGTEVAAALGRRFGDTHQVLLATTSDAPAPAWSDEPWMHTRLEDQLAAAGVTVLPRSRVARVDESGVRLGNGTVIPAATVVSTLGNVAPPLPGLERFQGADGLLAVDEFLQVTDGVWSAGDAAAVRRPSGVPAPKDAIWAIRAGTRVGRNIARAVHGHRPARLTFRGIGTVAAFAPGRAVAKVYGIRMSGIVAWTVRAAFFLWYVPSRRTAVRILGVALAAGLDDVLLRLRGVFRRPVPQQPVPVPVARPALFSIPGGKAPARRAEPLPAADPRRAAGA